MCGYLDTNMWHVMNATTGSPSASALSGQVGTESSDSEEDLAETASF